MPTHHPLTRAITSLSLCAVFVISTYAWFLGSHEYLAGDTSEYAIAFGRLFGIYTQLLLLLQVLLVARIPWIERAFAPDRMNVVHKYVGFSLLIALFTHPLLLVYGYSSQFETTWSAQFMDFVSNWHDVGTAVIAVCIYALIGLTSWHIVRQRVRYESWYGVHFLTYCALFLGFGHQTHFATFRDNAPAATAWTLLFFGIVGVFLLFRWAYPAYLSWRHAFVIERVVRESDTVTSLYLTGAHMDAYRFRAGQYASWRFHTGSILNDIRTGFFFPHPFSFSHAYNGTTVRMTAKNLGDMTAQLATLTAGMRVTLSQPRGAFVLPAPSDEAVPSTTKILCIAGGVGITPVRCLAEAAHARGCAPILLYAARTRADFVLLDECKRFAAKTVCFVSGEHCSEEGFCNGFVDADALAREVPDIQNYHVYVCGPAPMMQAITTLLKKASVPDTHIHFEKFGM